MKVCGRWEFKRVERRLRGTEVAVKLSYLVSGREAGQAAGRRENTLGYTEYPKLRGTDHLRACESNRYLK